jgi:hypothetical protein
MDSISPSARTYRWLGCAALVHAVVAFGFAYFVFSTFGTEHDWPARLWVSVVTLWFFWPIILALHMGRSWRRFALFVFVGLLVLTPSLLLYNRVAPRVFGLPWIVCMDPRSILGYYRAYLDGQSKARKEIAAGVLVIEESGFGAGFGPHVGILRERYHVEVRALAQCIVDETIIGHQDGYNSIAGPEINQRIGRDKIEAAREEGNQIAAAQQAAAEQRNKDLLKRLTTLPANSNLTLQTMWLYYKGGEASLSPDMERELGGFLSAVEQFIVPLVPKDAPAFELHISANLTRSARPKFETSAHSMPRSIYDPIYKEIPSLPVAQWTQDDLSVSLDYSHRESP